MERVLYYQGYEITLTSSQGPAGWVPSAAIRSATMQPHSDEWTIRDGFWPQPTEEDANRIAFEQAKRSIDDRIARPKKQLRK